MTDSPAPTSEAAEVQTLSLRRRTLGLIVWLAVCFGASAIGAIFTTAKIPEWYGTLIKPDWTPPSWLFGPVWTLLYAMMAVAAWIVWKQRGFSFAKAALITFLVQLALNSMWSWLFFGLERPDWAAIEIIVLWIAIAATIASFRKHSGIAAGLMVPYILWVTFAAALNVAIWRLNS
jgi:translocator protein